MLVKKPSMIFMALFVLSSTAISANESKNQAEVETRQFHYEDLRAFALAREKLDAGAAPKTAYQAYIELASAGFNGWMKRYRVSVDRFIDRVPKNEATYRQLPALERPLRAREGRINGYLDSLAALADSSEQLPVYYFVSNQHLLGGTPVALDDTEENFGIGIAVGNDDFAPGAPSGFDPDRVADSLVQVVVHEAAHILQLKAQGGRPKYISIYDQEKGSMAAIAIREGCAEYLTYLASGLRFGNRHEYVAANETGLWAAFKKIADEPPFSVPGWFSGRNEENPDWPFQVGYSLGFRICEVFHQAKDGTDTTEQLFRLYDDEDIAKVFAVYETKLSGE